MTFCPAPCCRGRATPSPSVNLIRLESADGLRSPKLIALPDRPSHYSTVIAPPLKVSATEKPDAMIPHDLLERQYRRHHEEYDPEAGRYIDIYLEVVPEPKPSLYRVCEITSGLWCADCKVTHKSIAPRIVRK